MEIQSKSGMSLSYAASALEPDPEQLDRSTGSPIFPVASMEPVRAACVGARDSILIRGLW